jgi:hypothetical protein
VEIHHSADQVLNINLDTMTFNSGWVKASDIFKGELAPLTGKMEVKVFYILSKIPAN